MVLSCWLGLNHDILLTILLQVGYTRALKVVANGQSILDCSHPEIHCYSFHSVERHALLGGQEFTPSMPATQGPWEWKG